MAPMVMGRRRRRGPGKHGEILLSGLRRARERDHRHAVTKQRRDGRLVSDLIMQVEDDQTGAASRKHRERDEGVPEGDVAHGVVSTLDELRAQVRPAATDRSR